jgi:6-pyruvoyltetrahydropterin/6-carboxytetrahydropterin synthase
MYEVSVEGSFRATHQVATPSGVPEPSHEHDWRVEAVWRGHCLDDRGLLVDFVRVEQELRSLATGFEGAHLNEHPMLAGCPPSAENVARVFFEKLDSVRGRVDARLWSVRVQEAPGCRAAYARD